METSNKTKKNSIIEGVFSEDTAVSSNPTALQIVGKVLNKNGFECEMVELVDTSYIFTNADTEIQIKDDGEFCRIFLNGSPVSNGRTVFEDGTESNSFGGREAVNKLSILRIVHPIKKTVSFL